MQYFNSSGSPFGPKRVWKQNENTPGLAMSRSCGDTIAHSIGVISTPEITEVHLQLKQLSRNICKPYYIVVATDGLWEQCSTEEVMAIISKHASKSPDELCNLLYRSASSKWQENDKIIDDITIIVGIIP